jgi:hypothetical protein
MSRLVPFKGWRQGGGGGRAAYFILAGPTQIQPQIQTPVMRLLLTVTHQHRDRQPEAQFIVSDWGDKVDNGHRVVVLARQATHACGLIRQPYAFVDFIPQ